MAEKIPIFKAPLADEKIRPTNMGAEAAREAGVMDARMGHAAGEALIQSGESIDRGLKGISAGLDTLGKQAERFDAFKESAAASTRGSQLYAALQDAFRQGQDDPNKPPDFYKQFNEQAEAQLQQFQGGFQTPQGQEAAARYAAEIRMGMSRTSLAAQSTEAAGNIFTDLRTTINNLAFAAGKDPTNLDSAVNQLRLHYNAYEHLVVDPAQRAKIEESYPVSLQKLLATSIQQMIDNPSTDPALIAHNIEKYGPQLGTEVGALQAYQSKVQRTTYNFNKEQSKDQFDAAEGAITAKFIQLDPQGNPTGKIVPPPDFYKDLLAASKMPGYQFKPEAIERLSGFADKINEEIASNKFVVTDKAIAANLDSRMFKDPHDPQAVDEKELWLLRQADKISDKDYMRYREVLKDNAKSDAGGQLDAKLVDQALEQVRNTLGDPTGKGLRTPQGNQAVIMFQTWFTPQYQAMLRRGISPAEAVAKLTTPEIIAKFAWDAGESGTAIKNILPPKPAEPGAIGKFFSHFFGGSTPAPEYGPGGMRNIPQTGHESTGSPSPLSSPAEPQQEGEFPELRPR